MVVDLVLLPETPIAWIYAVPLLLAASRWPPGAVAALGILLTLIEFGNVLVKGTGGRWLIYTVGVPILTGFAAFLAHQRQRLRESRALLQTAIDHFPNGSVNVFDRDLRYLFAGGKGLEQVSLSPQQVIGRTLADLFPPESVDYVRPFYHRAFAGETVEFPLDLGGFTYAITALPLRSEQGEVYAIMAVAQNVSERLGLERLQREFLAMAAHELRNPLTTIRGLAQLARRRGRADERTLDSIVQQTAQLERLVADLVDASRLDTGHLDLKAETVDMAALARAAVDQVQAQSEAHRFHLEAPDGAVMGQWDPARLSQVFANLLGNAVKYCSAGGAVVVRVAMDDQEARVSIQDQGPGIAAEDLPKLFDRFYRADGALSRPEGLGLGLYITRGIVEAHGGRIWADSTPGEGSTFTFSLPRARVTVASS